MSGKQLKLEPYKLEPYELKSGLDPHLQKFMIMCGQDYQPLRPLPVLLRLESEGAIAQIEDEFDFKSYSSIPLPNPADGVIVTGRLSDLSKISDLRKHDVVKSFKAALTTLPTAFNSVREARVPWVLSSNARAARRAADDEFKGKGVLVGIVDFGMDLWHSHFKEANLIRVWNQNEIESPQGGAKPPEAFPYGIEYNAEHIKSAIAQGRDVLKPRYVPEKDYYTAINKPVDADSPPSLHGTAVASIAIGNKGIAPEADVVFVQLANQPWDGLASFGNMAHLLEAVDYIFQLAKDRGQPAVVNLSLATRGGPHDGSSLVEQGLDALLTQSNRAIVVAAGNDGNTRTHIKQSISPDSSVTLEWNVVRGVDTENELEAWYKADGELEVSLITPGDTETLGPVKPGQTQQIMYGTHSVGWIIHREGDPNNGDNHIDIVLRPISDDQPEFMKNPGTWKIQLKATTARINTHVWLERELELEAKGSFSTLRFGDSRFSLGSLASGKKTVVVGAHSGPPGFISGFSSKGPIRNRRRIDEKPDLTAPGENITVAHSLTSDKEINLQGTSMAVPHVTGAIALILEKAKQSGRDLTSEQITEILRRSAFPYPFPDEVFPFDGGGAGKLNVQRALDRV